MSDETIEIILETHEFIGKAAKAAQQADEVFEAIAFNCEYYDYGICTHDEIEDDCSSHICPLPKEV